MNKQTEQTAKAHKKNSKTYLLRFHKVKDEDIIEVMDKQDNKINYVRELIRKDLRK